MLLRDSFFSLLSHDHNALRLGGDANVFKTCERNDQFKTPQNLHKSFNFNNIEA